jgi:molybdate transport system substrate-binding protein
MKRFASFLPLIPLLLAGCAPAAYPAPTTGESRTLTVFAAASLTDAFTEIGIRFEAAHPGVKVSFNFAGSQTLRTQLEEGAAADVFASANHTEMDNAVRAGLLQEADVHDFVTNELLVILPADNPAGLVELKDLARDGVKIVLGTDTVPAGKYARQLLENMSQDAAFGADFGTQVLANVVSNENDVKQVVVKVQLGEADAGIVYVSDVSAAPELQVIEIPGELNVVARYPLAALDKAAYPELASEFVDYVLSSEAQNILATWGFSALQ